MDGLGAEVSAKIRSAIKAKLIELEAYVDDELPDYIMVMVANNRNKAQMEDDLGLFLNNNTGAFTTWLHAVLEKLKKVTLEEVTKKEVKKKKTKKASDKPVKKSSKDVKERPVKARRSSPEPRSGGRGERRRESGRREERQRSPAPRSSRPARPPPGRGMDLTKANANMEELGTKRRKKAPAQGELDGSGGAEGYNPASLLQAALGKVKEKGSPRKTSTKKSSSSSVRKEARKRGKSEEKTEPGRARSASRERQKTNIINLKEESDFYPAGSRRPGRSPTPGRRGARSRSPPAQVASMVSKVVRPALHARAGRARRSPSYDSLAYDPEAESRRAAGRRDSARREEERGNRPRAGPRLSQEDLRYTDDLRRRHQLMESRVARGAGRGMAMDREAGRGLAMDREAGRGMAMDREAGRGMVMDREASRRGLAREEEGDTRVIVRRELTPEPEVSPPKKLKLEDEDAELLEMRRKALESLMKRTDQELDGRRQRSPAVRPARRGLPEESSDSSSSDSEDSTDDSEISDLEPEDGGGKAEPTFVVTLDGLDNKYFKHKQKGVLETARDQVKEEPKIKEEPKVKKSRAEKLRSSAPASKASSEGELELHPSEEFDEGPKKLADRPTMKVAARKRSPILCSDQKAAVSKKVAEVRPVVAAAPPPRAAKLAGSYAARLTAIKAAKAAKATVPAPDTATAAKPSPVTTAPKPVITAAPAPSRARITPPSPAKPRPVARPASVKPAAKEAPAKARVKRTPIVAPSPDPVPVVARFKSAPASLAFAPAAETVCKFWPNCKWKDACAFSHPPPPVRSAEVALSSTGNKFKWSAK